MAVARAERPAAREAIEGERSELAHALATSQKPRHQLADPGHLEAVIAVRDHVHVGRDEVEDRYVVGRERADAAVAPSAEVLAAALEAAPELPHRRRQVIGELGLRLILFVGVSVRI